jgi:hypothetical protein
VIERKAEDWERVRDIFEFKNNYNRNKLLAFAFAWLELISHKQFMPHFIKWTFQSEAIDNIVHQADIQKDSEDATQSELN